MTDTQAGSEERGRKKERNKTLWSEKKKSLYTEKLIDRKERLRNVNVSTRNKHVTG